MFDGKLSIPEAIATVGVIASLLFVGFELRQSNDMARTEMLTTQAQGWMQTTQNLAGNERLSELMFHSYEYTYREFNGADQIAFFNLNLGILKFYEIQFQQVRVGIIEEDDVSWPPATSQFFTSAIQHEMWPSYRRWFVQDFAEFWEQRFGLIETEGTQE